MYFHSLFKHRAFYQEGVAAVSTGDASSSRLGVRTCRTRVNWTQIYYPLTGRRQTDADRKSAFMLPYDSVQCNCNVIFLRMWEQLSERLTAALLYGIHQQSILSLPHTHTAFLQAAPSNTYSSSEMCLGQSACLGWMQNSQTEETLQNNLTQEELLHIKGSSNKKNLCEQPH